MTELEGLILYWKDRLSSLPPWGRGQERGAIRNTIAYLEELQQIKGGAQ